MGGGWGGGELSYLPETLAVAVMITVMIAVIVIT